MTGRSRVVIVFSAIAIASLWITGTATSHPHSYFTPAGEDPEEPIYNPTRPGAGPIDYSKSNDSQAAQVRNMLGWDFDYLIDNSGNGIQLHRVNFKGRRVFYGVDMPVVRVKYDGHYHKWGKNACPNYADRIKWHHWHENPSGFRRTHRWLARPAWCNNHKVCIGTFEQGGRQWMELSIYARIGRYHLYQSYYFSEDGDFEPVLYSRGISCPFKHEHAATFRFDVELDGAGSDTLYERDFTVSPSPAHYYTNARYILEANINHKTWSGGDEVTNEELRAFGTGAPPQYYGLRYWMAADHNTARRLELHRGLYDGYWTKFARWDVQARQYHPSAVAVLPIFGTVLIGPTQVGSPWLYGASGELNAITDDGPGSAEPLDDAQQLGTDLVLVYIAHLHHKVQSWTDPDEWHPVGPKLRVRDPQCVGYRSCRPDLEPPGRPALDEAECNAIEGCTFSSGTCEGPFAACASYQTESACTARPACEWKPMWDCIGAPWRCWQRLTDREYCELDAACQAVDLPSCRSAGVICSTYQDESTCTAQPACSWQRECTGIATQCSAYSIDSCADHVNCSVVWE